MEISKEVLKRLERSEAKLKALEAAGVDNWEGYGIALDAITKQEEFDDRVELCIDDALEILQEGAFEPSERGAGFSATDDSINGARVILNKCINDLMRMRDE